MDTIEATKTVMYRIQNIDPDNASKIMGYILIQDQGENEIIRLAFGPENLLASVVKEAKAFLDISSNTCSTPFSLSPFSQPRIAIPNNHSPWSSSGSYHSSPRASSYASVVGSSECSSQSVDLSDAIVTYPNTGADCNAYGEAQHHVHRRSCSVSDTFLGDDSGGWKSRMCFDRGFCKNGTSCKFVLGDDDETCWGSSSPTSIVGSPGIDGFENLLRIKAIQQQHKGGPHPFPFDRCIDYLSETHRSPSTTTLMMWQDIHQFGRFRSGRHDLALASMGLGNSTSRQIYLTFPADSTFKEEDVSNYFSIFGLVQDVRIPYQQKRMFGFVTFVLAETVKAILAKGNPHFICDSRVLVKPYKEKGKIPEKKHHQHQIERGDIFALESAEPFDHIPFGARMFNHDLMLKNKLDCRSDSQQAIDFHERNLMNMHLTTTDQTLLSQSQTNQSFVHHNDVNVVSGEDINGSDIQEPLTGGSLTQEVNDEDSEKNSSGKENSDLNEHQSFCEHILPDNLFASTTKTVADDNKINFNMKSCYFQLPRYTCWMCFKN
ncbi:hypothetical protein R6Q57_011252 [Mikania cordata]